MKHRAWLPLLLTGLFEICWLAKPSTVLAKQPQVAVANQNPLEVQTLYFKPSSSSITKISLETVSAHAAYLISHPQQQVILAGHVDGVDVSTEYAIALAEQFAKAKGVERTMREIGVSSQQIEIVSYGEEKPTCRSKSARCRQQNNRVEILYR